MVLAGKHRFGVTASRKLAKQAVKRNRAKRLVRELFRHNKPAAAVDVVVVPRREMLEASYDRIEAEFVSLLGKRVARGATDKHA